MMNFFDHPTRENIFLIAVIVILAILGTLTAYWMQCRHTAREMTAIAAQERHLYRALREQMKDIQRLRMVQHDAKNELLVLQGFLERGETAAAQEYVAQLLKREKVDRFLC